MMRTLDLWMDGVALTNIHPGIFISDIRVKPATISLTTTGVARRDGETVDSVRRTQPTVTVQFYILIRDIAEWQRVYQEILAWARGGVLEVYNRPGQRLKCRCTAFPEQPSSLKFTDPLELTLTGYEQAVWEEVQAASATLNCTANTESTGSIYVPGNAGEALVSVTVTPGENVTVNAVTVGIGDTQMVFASLGATTANPLTIGYDANGIQTIKVGAVSALGKRTGASSDDLIAISGQANAISVTADGACTATVSVRGVWL